MESTYSSSVSPNPPQLPPGFRFHPTDEELVVHYLKRKVASAPLPVTIMAEVDLYKFDPWELPSMATFGEQEWYFFSPRDRKYPNGARPNRAATSGYWKATGTDKPILSTSNGNQKVGVKKALVFYGGKPPKGIKTNWIMHEYRLIDNRSTSSKPQIPDVPKGKAALRLDDWVLCRIYKKNNTQRPMERDSDYSMESILATPATSSLQNPELPTSKATRCYGSLLEHEENIFEGLLTGEGMQNSSNNISQIYTVTSSSKQNNLSVALAATATTNSGPVKRVPAPEYWNEPNSTGSLSSTTFQGDLNSCSTAGGIDDTNSFVSLLNYQLPQSAPSYPATLFGFLSDRQQFILPSMNWNS